MIQTASANYLKSRLVNFIWSEGCIGLPADQIRALTILHDVASRWLALHIHFGHMVNAAEYHNAGKSRTLALVCSCRECHVIQRILP